MIEHAKQLWPTQHPALAPRVEFVGGSFFDEIPQADVYFMQVGCYAFKMPLGSDVWKGVEGGAEKGGFGVLHDPPACLPCCIVCAGGCCRGADASLAARVPRR